MADRLEGSSDILLYKLEHTKEVKESIRKAIETKGVRVSTDTPFREYADKIRLIQTNIVEPSLKGLVCHHRCHTPKDASSYQGQFMSNDKKYWLNMVCNNASISLNNTYANYDENVKGIAVKNNTSNYAMGLVSRGTIKTYTLEFCFDPLNNFKSGSSTPILFRDYYQWYSSYYRSRGLALYLDSSSNLILSTANNAYKSSGGYPAHNSAQWNKLNLGVIEPRKLYLCIRVNGNSFTIFNSQTSQTIKGSMTATTEFLYRNINMMAYTTCTLHSLRLYNRVISDEEMYRNMNCDQVAYGF